MSAEDLSKLFRLLEYLECGPQEVAEEINKFFTGDEFNRRMRKRLTALHPQRAPEKEEEYKELSSLKEWVKNGHAQDVAESLVVHHRDVSSRLLDQIRRNRVLKSALKSMPEGWTIEQLETRFRAQCDELAEKELHIRNQEEELMLERQRIEALRESLHEKCGGECNATNNGPASAPAAAPVPDAKADTHVFPQMAQEALSTSPAGSMQRDLGSEHASDGSETLHTTAATEGLFLGTEYKRSHNHQHMLEQEATDESDEDDGTLLVQQVVPEAITKRRQKQCLQPIISYMQHNPGPYRRMDVVTKVFKPNREQRVRYKEDLRSIFGAHKVTVRKNEARGLILYEKPPGSKEYWLQWV